ncbi:MAG: hypothetical protein K0Q95_201 [Bacteroidota bacterium]|jgi:hypothetical protein|nr:hypothetical protein [Bacteroidota bacterium]
MKAQHKAGLDFASSSAIIHSGFIAQEVELAAQETGFVSSIVHHPANENDAYAVAYGEIVVPLVKAVQELSRNNDSLKSKIANNDSINDFLKDEINDLKDLINGCCASNKQT